MNEYYDFENFEPDAFDIEVVNEIFAGFKESVKQHKAIIKQMESSI
jgi:stress-induced morphogen